MGKLDDMAKELYEDNLVFADTMNMLFFDGKPMIRAQDLSPLDPTEEHTIFDDDFVSKTEREEKTDKTQSKTEVFSNQKYNRENHLLKSKNEFLSGIKREKHLLRFSQLLYILCTKVKSISCKSSKYMLS